MLTAKATLGDIERTVLATGTVNPYLQIDVGSRASGAIVSLKVDVGDRVQKGDVIADIDSATQTNNLNTAAAQLTDVLAQKAGDEAALVQAQLALGRATSLYAAQAGPLADVEANTRTVKSAKAVLASVAAQVQQAQISVKTARVNLGYTHITAPFTGVVLVVATRQGQTVNAAQSAPTIITLGQLDRMTVNAQIAEADVIHVVPGMPVHFTILGDPDHVYTGELRLIQPAPTSYVSAAAAVTAAASASSATAVYYNGVFDVDNADGRLLTTMTANVSVVLDRASRTLIIPASALGEMAKDGTYDVRVATKGGKPVTHRVKVGISDGARVQVLSGLVAGDDVVIGTQAPVVAASSATPAASPQRGAPHMQRTPGVL